MVAPLVTPKNGRPLSFHDHCHTLVEYSLVVLRSVARLAAGLAIYPAITPASYKSTGQMRPFGAVKS
jgi:hypothetical protein